jgi:hypothetical protein
MDENIESLDNMLENLKECGLVAESLPLVFQWNKRDLPDIHPVAVLEEKLNPQGLPSFGAVATTGQGVFDTLKKITKMVLNEARTRATAKSPGTFPAAAPPETAAPEPVAAGPPSTSTVGEPPPQLSRLPIRKRNPRHLPCRNMIRHPGGRNLNPTKLVGNQRVFTANRH